MPDNDLRQALRGHGEDGSAVTFIFLFDGGNTSDGSFGRSK